MKIKNIAPILMMFLCIPYSSFGQIGFSWPIGSRSQSMGGIGYVLADDASVLFYNPAGLGFNNEQWDNGALYYYRQSYWLGVSSFYSIVFQDTRLKGLGFSGYLNQFNLDNIDEIDETHNVTGRSFYQYEVVPTLGCGYLFYSNSFMKNSIGLAVKYQNSQAGLVNGPTSWSSSAFALDVGYLIEFFNSFRIGIVLKNISTPATFLSNDSITYSETNSMQYAIGVGYKADFNKENKHVLNIATELSYSHDEYWKDFHGGIELLFLNTFGGRIGFKKAAEIDLVDFSFGTGFKLFNHFNFDTYVVFLPIQSPILGWSLSISNILKWDNKDWKWWEVN